MDDLNPYKAPTFSLSSRDWVVFAFGCAVVVVTEYVQATASLPLSRSLFHIIGKIIGLGIVAGLPALLAFYFSRRSKKAASITFTIFVILGALGQVNEAITKHTANTGQPQSPAARDQLR